MTDNPIPLMHFAFLKMFDFIDTFLGWICLTVGFGLKFEIISSGER